ncbi:type II toxin-antitoxin system RelE/ParE family toxin [Maricaulis sp.]|uniref:type II toxin-antitoxin system RelE/ParE family toxin n=1 Tax=Maricaulis sp. TaxID=1486257 RepID=UPI001B110538|nr:type II toxin-antitoxin system RelE/ParE family toxin [Maricaulis sp.]MBO6796415.1 type II toxin-antitoxin system RelE/ParE family toxin [Maricaulis sp.]
MKVEIAEAALDDLEALYLDGALKFGAARAERYQVELVDSFQKLIDYPRSRPEHPAIGCGVRLLRFRAHIILYRIAGARIEILRIRHAHEDWKDP